MTDPKGTFPASELKEGQSVQYESKAGQTVETNFLKWNKDGSAYLKAKHEADINKIFVEGKRLVRDQTAPTRTEIVHSRHPCLPW